jgi:transmembrane sensor
VRGMQPVAVRDAASAWVVRRDAGLSAAEEREFQHWLESDPAHRAAMAAYDSVWAELDRPLASGVAEEFLRCVALRRRIRRRRHLASLAAGVFIVVTAGIALRTPTADDVPIATAVARLKSAAVVHMPLTETLADGTVVERRPGSELAVAFSGAERRVVLAHGDVHFAVEPDAARPFVVEVGCVAVRAIGTVFAVSARTGGLELVVTEGRVAVEMNTATGRVAGAQDAGGNDAGRLATLDAGQAALVEVSNSGAPTAMVRAMGESELHSRMAWRAPRLEFTRTPLAKAVALFNKHAPAGDRRLVIVDPELADIRVGGLFRADSTEAFVEILRTALGVESELRGDAEIVLRKAS